MLKDKYLLHARLSYEKAQENCYLLKLLSTYNLLDEFQEIYYIDNHLKGILYHLAFKSLS